MHFFSARHPTDEQRGPRRHPYFLNPYSPGEIPRATGYRPIKFGDVACNDTRMLMSHGPYNARDYGVAGDGVTNDQPALAALVEQLGAAYAADRVPRVIYCPPGVYSVRDQSIVWRSGVSLIGAGAGATRFVLANPGKPNTPVVLAAFTAQQHGASRENHLADCTFASFEIDGAKVDLERYDPLAKGLGLQYLVRARFRDLYIHDTAGTGLGCDFLQDAVIEAIHAQNCGRQDNGEQMGGAGIGIGIGGWGPIERLTVISCIAVDNGTNGIFVELQRENWPPPRGIKIIACHAAGNRFGISDWGAEGLIVSACIMTANHEAGFDVSSKGTAKIGGRGGILSDCVIDSNVRDGVSIGNTPGPYAVRGNRISGNGRYGYREHNLAGGDDDPARVIVLESNEIWANALGGIHLDGDMRDAAIVGNRVRNNGTQAEGAASSEGRAVTCTATSLRDTGARWRPDGHKGKMLTVGEQCAMVVSNTEQELSLAPYRPGAPTAWKGATPARGSRYHLPDAPPVRAGLMIAANLHGCWIRGNRIWDDRTHETQTHGLWITERGKCVACRIEDNGVRENDEGVGVTNEKSARTGR